METLTYDDYYEIVRSFLAAAGWLELPDPEQVARDFENGMDPCLCAELFIKQFDVEQ